MGKYTKNFKELPVLFNKLIVSERDLNFVISGMTGEGKSTLLIQIMKYYCKLRGIKFSFNMLTWSREELMSWIDGKKDKNNKRVGCKPFFTPIGIDELFHLFYRRQWFKGDQISGIQCLNMCRDKKLLIGGCVPNFWDLDSAFASRIRFYIYIPKRSVAWVFEQENSPYAKDKWNYNYNMKMFSKYGNPYFLKGFVMEILYNDLSDKEKIAYNNIRNTKRVLALEEEQTNQAKEERYKDIKNQRDRLIKLLYGLSDEYKTKLTYKDLSDVLGVSQSAVKMIMIGQR